MAFLLGLVVTALILVLNSCAGVTVKANLGDYNIDRDGHITITPRAFIVSDEK